MCGYDYKTDAVCETVKRIDTVRKNGNIIDEIIELGKTCTEAKSAGITKQPIDNYTRLLISMFKYTGLLEENRSPKYYKKKGNRVDKFFQLTEYGASKLKAYNNMKDLRLSEYDKYSDIEKKALIRIGFYQMLDRIGFDISPISKQLEDDMNVCSKILQGKELLFSPYQMLEYNVVNEALGISEPATSHSASTIVKKGTEHRDTVVDTNLNIHSLKAEALIKSKKSDLSKNEQISKMLLKRLNASKDINIGVVEFLKNMEKMKQSDFYPLVADLLGFIFNREAFAPSAGNNNMRYDVMIPDSQYSIPVEVKSPTEEEMLSVKAIRQATENKILLLARKPYKTTYEISSFACGFKLPNDRSDVYKLIDEIYKTYKINIAILDMETLIRAAFYCASTKSYYEVSDFKNKKGIIRFENL